MINEEINSAAVKLSRALRLVGLDPKEMSYSAKTISYLCKVASAGSWEKAIPQILELKGGWALHVGERYMLADRGGATQLIKPVFFSVRSDAIVSAAELLGGAIISMAKGKPKPVATGARASFDVEDVRRKEKPGDFGIEVDLGVQHKPRTIRPHEFNTSRAGIAGVVTEGSPID